MRSLGILLAVALSVAGLAACDSLAGYDELTLPLEPYTGDELRTDGYYFYSGPTDEGERFYALFLFRNGVVRYGGSSVGRETLERKFEEYGGRRYDWGVFVVNGDRIEVERWYPGDGPHTPAIVQSGRVLDDTTFVLTSSGGAETTYHFRAFSPKPDSTSAFLL